METASLTANDLLRILKANIAPGDIKPEGEGWATVKDYASEWSMGREQAGKLLKAGIEKSLVEKFRGKIGGKVTFFYRAAAK